MKVVFLSPHFPVNYHNFCARLHELGATVFGIADEAYEKLSNQLKDSLDVYWKVSSLENTEEVKAAFRELQNRYGTEDEWRVESHNEHWLELEATLREEFNLPGFKLKDLERIKQKSGMKQLFSLANVPAPRGLLASTLKEVQDFVSQVGFPIVAKPDIGVGAVDTFKLHNEEELREFFAVARTRQYIFEEFINGQIESFDGLVDRQGNVVFYTSHKFNSGIMEVVTEDSELWYYSLRDIPDDLKQMGHRIIKVSGLREKFFHFEFFRTKKNNSLVALEINMRPPGGYTLDMFNFANDIDLYREWASIVVNGTFGATQYNRPYYCTYVSRKDRFDYANPHSTIMEKYWKEMVMHASMPSIFQRVMGVYFYIFRTKTIQEMKLIVEFIQKRSNTSDS